MFRLGHERRLLSSDNAIEKRNYTLKRISRFRKPRLKSANLATTINSPRCINSRYDLLCSLGNMRDSRRTSSTNNKCNTTCTVPFSKREEATKCPPIFIFSARSRYGQIRLLIRASQIKKRECIKYLYEHKRKCLFICTIYVYV